MINRLSFLYIGLIAILSTSGVAAAWQYANGVPPPTSESVSVSLNEFYFAPEQVLPGGDAVESEIGENHLWLIELILNENDKNYGLNYAPNGVLHSYLKKEGVVFCNQKTTGGNLKFILDTKYDTHKLYYCLEKKSDTEYYCYTFETDALSTVGGSATEMEVYRTILVKTDRWRATTSYRGMAKTKRLSSMGASASSGSIIYSIDVTTWRSA